MLSGRRNCFATRRSIAALEFGLVAPIYCTLALAVFDIGRVLIIWEQVQSAADAVAQAAEKLSITPGATTTSLTATQMQTAMSTLYAVMPGLNLGNNSGIDRGSYAVTLSGVAYLPLCVQSNGCTAETTLTQTPYTLWSSYLTQGGVQLDQTPTMATPLLRACGALTTVAQFPNDSTQLTKMIDATKQSGGAIIQTPQVVADVWYQFTPSFPFFLKPMTLYASAAQPVPLGGTDQEITFNPTAPTGNVVSCTLP
ncbi:MAG TPA: TadE/TadG family type IV pilus assembly protein [Acetobacteraceae bacterium]|nr:TadE/TadG family type IV pilus assembly protein [Acetobacteraceae bacterium]